MSDRKTCRNVLTIAGIALASIISACGGGNSNGDGTGILSISVTDAAVEGVDEVWVEFSGVTLKPPTGEPIEYVFDPVRRIDLLTLTGENVASLLPDTEVAAGRYPWMRLSVNATFDNVFDSYAMRTDGSMVELEVPSGEETGLKLVSGFTVTQNQVTDIVIDWDLRQALVDPIGQPGLYLRPALRITDMTAFGTLSGVVQDNLLMTSESEMRTCTNDLAMGTGSAVYVYSPVVTEPGDIGDANASPLTTATVTQNQDGMYVYEANFLSPGDYTAALTCQASDDFADSDEADFEFSSMADFTIVDEQVTIVDFPPPEPSS